MVSRPFWRLWPLRLLRGQAAAPALLEALAPAPATRKVGSGTSGYNTRRKPFWRLWILRLLRRQPAAPAATTRAAGPSGGSGYCACHEEDSRPFWRLWVLHLPRRQQAAPAATTRAAAPSGGSGYCACHEEDSQRHQRRQRAPQPLLEALGTAPATRKTASGTSGDNARRSPFWRLWVLRLPRGRQPAAPAATTRAPSAGSGYCACHEEDSQRRQPAPLLEALGIAPATRKTAAPSRGSGYCACHEDSKRHRRRQRAPQPLLETLGTAPATRKTASGTSGDNPRRNPFWRLWVLRLPRGRQPAAPAATTRAATPSGGSGYCACHEENSQRHQRRQPAPQPLLQALGTAPATKKTASGDNPRRSPFWRLWVLRLPRGRQPAATTRAAAPSAGSGYCACHEENSQRRQPAPQPLLEALGIAPTTKKTASDNPCRSPFYRLWVLRLPRGKQDSRPFWRLCILRLPRRQQAAPAATTRAAAPSGGSGYCACREDSQRHQRRQRAAAPSASSRYCACNENSQRRQPAPQPLLAALGTAPSTKTASGDNARRSPFCNR